jgi:hypothetical protein
LCWPLSIKRTERMSNEMEKALKKMLSGLKKLGMRLHATGGNYWLGFVPMVLCFVLKAPERITTLTVCAFGIWLFLCIGSLIPDGWLLISKKSGKNELAEAFERIQQLESELSESQKRLADEKELTTSLKNKIEFLKGVSLKQFCLRVTERLRSLRFDTASWEFICLEPFEALLSHQTVRLKLFDAEEYIAAEVTYENSGEIKFSLIENVAKEEEADSERTAEKAVQSVPEPETSEILKDWMMEHLDEIRDLGYDAYAKGRKDFTVKNGLPNKSYWPLLCGLLEQEGYRFAKVSGNGILLGIGPKTKVA